MSDTAHPPSVAASAQLRLAQMIPQALEKLSEAINGGEIWAIKLLLEAAGFERIARQVFEGAANEEADPIISTEFERELVERVLNVFRGRLSEQGARGNDQD
jgi:hypothetical protein